MVVVPVDTPRFRSQAQVVADQEMQAESKEFLVEAKDEQLAAAANTRFANRLKNGFVADTAASLVQVNAGKVNVAHEAPVGTTGDVTLGVSITGDKDRFWITLRVEL